MSRPSSRAVVLLLALAGWSAGASALGPAVAAAGSASFASSGPHGDCASTALVGLQVNLADGSGRLALGDGLACVGMPAAMLSWPAAHCAGSPDGAVACSRTQSFPGGAALTYGFTLGGDGDLAYRALLTGANPATFTLDGGLARA